MTSYFDHQGDTLHYITAGSPENPPLLMVHGYTSSHHVWRTTIPELQSHYYCIAIDLLGHGASDVPPDGNYSIAAQAKRVLALVNHLELDTFTLIGHSMGGQISLYLASALASARVDRVINVAGVVSPRLSDLVERTVFLGTELAYRMPWLAALARHWRDRPWWAQIQFASWFYDMASLDFASWAVDRESATHRGAHIMWYRGKWAIKSQDMTPLLAHITAPTLTIFGAEDNVILPQDKHLADEHIPDHRLVVLDACGHFPMYEQTARYLNAIRDFLGISV